MCRMLAKASPYRQGILAEMEQCPSSLLWLSKNGIKSDPDVRGRHDDGCGMAYAADGRIESIRRGKEEFWDKSYHYFAASAQSKLYIAHNRFASKGLDLSISGAHPFLREKNDMPLAFCHNGGVESFMDEAKRRNISDSEILLEHLVDEMNDVNAEEVCSAISHIAKTTNYTSLCAFLLTPSELYIWRLFNENDNAEYDKLSRYYTLYISIRNDHTIVASEPLDDESWQLLPNRTFLAITPHEDGIRMSEHSISI